MSCTAARAARFDSLYLPRGGAGGQRPSASRGPYLQGFLALARFGRFEDVRTGVDGGATSDAEGERLDRERELREPLRELFRRTRRERIGAPPGIASRFMLQ